MDRTRWGQRTWEHRGKTFDRTFSNLRRVSYTYASNLRRVLQKFATWNPPTHKQTPFPPALTRRSSNTHEPRRPPEGSRENLFFPGARKFSGESVSGHVHTPRSRPRHLSTVPRSRHSLESDVRRGQYSARSAITQSDVKWRKSAVSSLG